MCGNFIGIVVVNFKKKDTFYRIEPDMSQSIDTPLHFQFYHPFGCSIAARKRLSMLYEIFNKFLAFLMSFPAS